MPSPLAQPALSHPSCTPALLLPSSGGGWHQDEEFVESQELPEPGAQFKCLLYAEPVFGDNGPFELLVNYDRKQLARMQVSDPKELGPGGRSRWHRFTDETIANVTRTGGGGAFVLELHNRRGDILCCLWYLIFVGFSDQFRARAAQSCLTNIVETTLRRSADEALCRRPQGPARPANRTGTSLHMSRARPCGHPDGVRMEQSCLASKTNAACPRSVRRGAMSCTSSHTD